MPVPVHISQSSVLDINSPGKAFKEEGYSASFFLTYWIFKDKFLGQHSMWPRWDFKLCLQGMVHVLEVNMKTWVWGLECPSLLSADYSDDNNNFQIKQDLISDDHNRSRIETHNLQYN